MSNTSGIPFADHAASMGLCFAALTFAFDCLRSGGGFVCKFFNKAESKGIEMKMRALFEKVVREKPESSRGVSFLFVRVGVCAMLTGVQASKEAYFICLRRKENASREDVLGGRE